MANEELFTNRAENYKKARPGYANEVIEMLLGEILKPDSKIADIGSGTGLFAKPLVEYGFDVYCVEPNAKMREQAVREFVGNPHFIPVAASAEETLLEEYSIDVVAAASALHWFEMEKFQAECKRILKPDGVFFAVVNCRDYSDDFTVRQHTLCQKLCPDFTSLSHGMEKTIPRLEILLGKNYQSRRFDFPLAYTKEKFIQRSLSSSYAPEPGSPEEREYIEGLRQLMDEFFPYTDEIVISNQSAAFWGKLI